MLTRQRLVEADLRSHEIRQRRRLPKQIGCDPDLSSVLYFRREKGAAGLDPVHAIEHPQDMPRVAYWVCSFQRDLALISPSISASSTCFAMLGERGCSPRPGFQSGLHRRSRKERSAPWYPSSGKWSISSKPHR